MTALIKDYKDGDRKFTSNKGKEYTVAAVTALAESHDGGTQLILRSNGFQFRRTKWGNLGWRRWERLGVNYMGTVEQWLAMHGTEHFKQIPHESDPAAYF